MLMFEDLVMIFLSMNLMLNLCLFVVAMKPTVLPCDHACPECALLDSASFMDIELNRV